MLFYIPVEKEFFCVHVMTAGLGAKSSVSFSCSRKAQFPFLAHVAMALISAMLFPTFMREETQLFTVFAPPVMPASARFL
jgi:hypothetical protein